MITIADLKIGFEYFFSKITYCKDYSFFPSKKENTAINNFQKLLPINAGPQFLFDYLAYQFELWRTRYTRLGKGIVKVEWIYGPKAFETWKNKPFDYQYFYREGLLPIHNISLNQFLKLFNQTNISISLDIISQIERKRYLNTRRGFYHCLQCTTGHSEQDKSCLKCIFEQKCKGYSDEKTIQNIRNISIS